MEVPELTTIPINPGSDGDPTHRPKSEGWLAVPSPVIYLEKLATQWMHKRGEARPGVRYYLDRLPSGYVLYVRPRPNKPSVTDRFLYGHPSHKWFDSPNRFYPHFEHLMQHGSSLGCQCTVCLAPAGSSPLPMRDHKKMQSTGNAKPTPSARPQSGTTASQPPSSDAPAMPGRSTAPPTSTPQGQGASPTTSDTQSWPSTAPVAVMQGSSQLPRAAPVASTQVTNQFSTTPQSTETTSRPPLSGAPAIPARNTAPPASTPRNQGTFSATPVAQSRPPTAPVAARQHAQAPVASMQAPRYVPSAPHVASMQRQHQPVASVASAQGPYWGPPGYPYAGMQGSHQFAYAHQVASMQGQYPVPPGYPVNQSSASTSPVGQMQARHRLSTRPQVNAMQGSSQFPGSVAPMHRPAESKSAAPVPKVIVPSNPAGQMQAQHQNPSKRPVPQVMVPAGRVASMKAQRQIPPYGGAYDPNPMRSMLHRLRMQGTLDEEIREPLNMDWRVETNLLHNSLQATAQLGAYLPRVGEVVLFMPRSSTDGTANGHTDNNTSRERSETERASVTSKWRAGVVTQVPQQLLLKHEDRDARTGAQLYKSAYRIEPLPQPQHTDKSLSKQAVSVHIQDLCPLEFWHECLKKPQHWHPTVTNALAIMSTVSVIGRHRFTGKWPSTTIHCSGIFIGSELIIAGDAVRLMPPDDVNRVTQVLRVETIQIKLSDIQVNRPTILDNEGYTYKSQIVLVGRCFESLDTIPSLSPSPDSWDALALTSPAMRSYGKWRQVHEASQRVEVPFNRVLGRLHDREAIRCWFPGPLNYELSIGVQSVRHGREIARKLDGRILPGKNFHWSNTRAEALDLATFNGQPLSTSDPERDEEQAETWRRAAYILENESEALPNQTHAFPSSVEKTVASNDQNHFNTRVASQLAPKPPNVAQNKQNLANMRVQMDSRDSTRLAPVNYVAQNTPKLVNTRTPTKSHNISNALVAETCSQNEQNLDDTRDSTSLHRPPSSSRPPSATTAEAIAQYKQNLTDLRHSTNSHNVAGTTAAGIVATNKQNHVNTQVAPQRTSDSIMVAHNKQSLVDTRVPMNSRNATSTSAAEIVTIPDSSEDSDSGDEVIEHVRPNLPTMQLNGGFNNHGYPGLIDSDSEQGRPPVSLDVDSDRSRTRLNKRAITLSTNVTSASQTRSVSPQERNGSTIDEEDSGDVESVEIVDLETIPRTRVFVRVPIIQNVSTRGETPNKRLRLE